jgi:hypothetical protein
MLGLGNREGWPLLGMLDYLDNSCFYRSRKSLFTVFGKYFDIELIEDDYIRACLDQSRLRILTPVVQWPIIKPFAKGTFRKLGGMVMLTTKRAE